MMGWGQFKQNRDKIIATGKAIDSWQSNFYARLNDEERASSTSNSMADNLSRLLRNTGKNSFSGLGSSVFAVNGFSAVAVKGFEESPSSDGFEKQKKDIRQFADKLVHSVKNGKMKPRWEEARSSPLTEVYDAEGGWSLPPSGEEILKEQKTLVKSLAEKQGSFFNQFKSDLAIFQKTNQSLEANFQKMANQWGKKETEESGHGE